MTLTFPTHAMLLAAGLGERLRPLTLSTPKPLIPISSRPLIEYNLRLLKKYGVEKVVINLFHLGEKIESFLGDGKRFGLKIEYSPESQLLGTGGGVKAAENFFDKKTFFLMNADILIDLNLTKLFQAHQEKKALATLAVSPSIREDVKNWVFVDTDQRILDIGEKAPSAGALKTIFTGAHVIEPEVLDLLPKGKKSCIIQDAYLPLLRKGKALNGYLFDGYWRDLGTPERYEEVKKEFTAGWPYTALSPEDFI
jgi:NDP-sugar pyrophosphorylase family protein